MRQFVALFLTVFLLTSCFGGGGPAPVIYHGQSSGAGSAGVHPVVAGDTLYSVSRRYRLPMRDIAMLNNLRAPFILREGQRLRLPPPQDYVVQYGDTLYGISRTFDVNLSELARTNNINAPFTVRTGQRLRLPSAFRPSKPKPVEGVKVASARVAPVQSDVLPRSKPAPAVAQSATITNKGVPVPQNKPSYTRPTSVKVSKVSTRAPKRASSKFLRPVSGRIVSSYGVKKNGLHNDGINIAAARGTRVKAAENGVVVYSGNALKGSGNLVLIRHDDQWMSAYAHLDSIDVRKGQTVKRGAAIGKVGSTGSVATPQLHFELRRGTSAKNPTRYLE